MSDKTVGHCKHGRNFMGCYRCEQEQAYPAPTPKHTPTVGECLDAILALLTEQEATGTISRDNLTGVRRMVGEYRSKEAP